MRDDIDCRGPRHLIDTHPLNISMLRVLFFAVILAQHADGIGNELKSIDYYGDDVI